MISNLATLPAPPEAGNNKIALEVGTLIVSADKWFRSGVLVFQSGKIIAAGGTELLAEHTDAEVWDGRGYLCAPGLINAHTHVALAQLRGLGHGHANMISELFFRTEAKLSPEMLEPLSFSYIVDGLRSGVTCFGDHYYFIEGVAAALERVGVRGAVAECLVDRDGPFAGRSWPRAKKLLENWPYSDLVRPVVGPHATDTCSPTFLKELAGFAKSNNFPLHMHLSQTKQERDQLMAQEGASPVAVAEKAGALGPNTLAVHLVATDEDDWRRIHDSGTTVGLCPSSQVIFEKLAPLSGLLREDTPAALGNDCAASNDSADLLAEGRSLGLLSRHEGAPLSHQRIFEFMTKGGAQVFGLPCGQLSPGLAADFFLAKHDITLDPMADPICQTLYSGTNRNVEHVMVNGKWVLFGRELQQANEADLRQEFLTAVKQIHRIVGGPHANLNLQAK